MFTLWPPWPEDVALEPTDAEIGGFCMLPAVPPAPAWNAGQVLAFIGAWVGADLYEPNLGAGVDMGAYDIWMKVGATGCVPPPCDDKADNDGDAAVDSDDPGCARPRSTSTWTASSGSPRCGTSR